MSQLTTFFGNLFTRDKNKIFLNLILSAVKVFFGSVANHLFDITQKAVENAEFTGKPGADKWDMAYKEVRSKLYGVNVPEVVISLLIEAFVLIINPKVPAA